MDPLSLIYESIYNENRDLSVLNNAQRKTLKKLLSKGWKFGDIRKGANNNTLYPLVYEPEYNKPGIYLHCYIKIDGDLGYNGPAPSSEMIERWKMEERYGTETGNIINDL